METDARQPLTTFFTNVCYERHTHTIHSPQMGFHQPGKNS